MVRVLPSPLHQNQGDSEGSSLSVTTIPVFNTTIRAAPSSSKDDNTATVTRYKGGQGMGHHAHPQNCTFTIIKNCIIFVLTTTPNSDSDLSHSDMENMAVMVMAFLLDIFLSPCPLSAIPLILNMASSLGSSHLGMNNTAETAALFVPCVSSADAHTRTGARQPNSATL